MKVINAVNRLAKYDDQGSPMKSRTSANQSPLTRNGPSPVRNYKMNYTSPYKISQNAYKKKTAGNKEELVENIMGEDP